MSGIVAWRDAYGVWNASVPEHAYARPADAARRAIRRELSERESPSYNPLVTGVHLYEIKDGRRIYREHVR